MKEGLLLNDTHELWPLPLAGDPESEDDHSYCTCCSFCLNHLQVDSTRKPSWWPSTVGSYSAFCFIHLDRNSLSICMYVCVRAQSCQTLQTHESSPPGSSGHGVSQARILEWAAISSSRGIFPTQGSNPRLLWLLHWKVDSLSLKHSGLIILTWITSAFVWGIRHCLSCWLNQGILFCIYLRTLK